MEENREESYASPSCSGRLKLKDRRKTSKQRSTADDDSQQQLKFENYERETNAKGLRWEIRSGIRNPRCQKSEEAVLHLGSVDAEMRLFQNSIGVVRNERRFVY